MKNKLDKQIEKKEAELETLKEKREAEKNKVNFIVIDGWAYETKEHDFNKELGDIEIPKGRELWLPSEVYRFYEDKNLKEKLNLSKCWFFVRQVREDTTDVARFYANSGCASLNWGMVSSDSYSYLGVRFKWKVKN